MSKLASIRYTTAFEREACIDFMPEVIMGAMAHHEWEVRWTAAAVLLQVPLTDASLSAPRFPETLLSEIRGAVCLCLKSDRRAVRDVAEYMLNRGLRGDDQLCRLALQVKLPRSQQAEAPSTDRQCRKRPPVSRPVSKFAKSLKLASSQPLHLE